MQQGIEFYTSTCLNWQPLLAPEKHKQIILDSFKFLIESGRIWLYGYVIMPNHIHVLWRRQEAWLNTNVNQHFTKFTAQQFKFNMLDSGQDLKDYESTQNDQAYHFWERRPYKATMYNRQVLEQKLEYIHLNPVKSGLCQHPEDYVYPSAAYYYENKANDMLTHYMEHM